MTADETLPGWAAALSSGARPGLVARAVALAWPAAHPERLRRVLAARLDAGMPTDAAAVLDALEAAARPAGPLRGAELEAAVSRLGALDARVLIVGDPGYPSRLAAAWPELGAPLWLFVRSAGGRLPEGPTVAVVGTRRPSLDGLRTARQLGGLLAERGVVVVSGMARGIDQAAHRGALGGGGPTVAVLGAGLDVDYPAGDARLRAAVAAAGGLVSEHLPGVAPRPKHFLWRNRIISGLADATVVVEGRQRSGALQTARLAAAQGREVLAVPGSLNAPTSRAPLDLIRDGAQPVTRLEDVLDAIGLGEAGTGGPAQASPDDLEPGAAAVLDLLGSVPATPGALAVHSGRSVAQVLVAVGELTARGLAQATPAGVVRASG